MLAGASAPDNAPSGGLERWTGASTLSGMEAKLRSVRVGDQVFLEEGGEECGAVRDVRPEGGAEIVVYVENCGEFPVAASAIRSAHDGKVILDPDRLDPALRDAIAHAHDREVPGL